MANLSGGLCFFDPKTAVLQNDQRLRQLYNQAMFGRGAVADVISSRTVLACALLNKFYTPYSCPKFEVAFGKSKERWASLTCSAAPGRKPQLTFEADVFWLTPAFVTSVIGHEMVHAAQCDRKYSVLMTGLDTPRTTFWDLEAYSWELGLDAFPRTFKVKGADLIEGMQPQERKELEKGYRCTQWDVRKALADFVAATGRNQRYGKNLVSYMQQDPWISQVWLPKNRNWATQAAGPQPKECEEDSEPKKK